MTKLTTERFMALFFKLSGIALLLGALYMGYGQWEYIKHAQRTMGNVIDFYYSYDPTSKGSMAHTYFPIVRFVDGTGATWEVRSHFGSTRPAYEKGAKVPILYVPANPQEAEIESFEALWTAPILMGVIGGGFFLSSFFLL